MDNVEVVRTVEGLWYSGKLDQNLPMGHTARQ
jgi:hypothetical protein